MDSSDQNIRLFDVSNSLIRTSNHRAYLFITFFDGNKEYTLASGDFTNQNDDIFLYAECLNSDLKEIESPYGKEGYELKSLGTLLKV